MRFVCHELIADLMDVELHRITVPVRRSELMER
jgi:hypothetical protein